MEYATREWFGGLGLKTTGGRFSGFGLKPGCGSGKNRWRHVASSRACLKAKLSHEGAWPSNQRISELGHNTFRVRWFALITEGYIENV